MSAGSLRWMSALCVFGCAYCTSTWSSCRATFHVRRICKVRLRVCFRASCLNASQVVRERRPCHLYFDLEYVPGHNPAADGDTLLERLLQLLEAALRCAPFAVLVGTHCRTRDSSSGLGQRAPGAPAAAAGGRPQVRACRVAVFKGTRWTPYGAPTAARSWGGCCSCWRPPSGAEVSNRICIFSDPRMASSSSDRCSCASEAAATTTGGLASGI